MWPTWLRSTWQRLAARGASAPAAALPAEAAPARSAAAAPVRRGAQQRARFEEMEPRLLYAADNPAAWLAGAVVQVVPSAEVQVVPAATSTPVVQTAQIAQQVRRELVVIDSGVAHGPGLVEGLRASRPAEVQLELLELQPGSDGLQQISQALAQHSGLSAVHIVAHGEQAALQLGSTRLDAAALASRSAELQAWRSALTDDADLLLYGCDVAAGDTGAAFIQRLAGLTGADVAASTNATGAAVARGDWLLEAQVGDVTRGLADVPALEQAFAGLLGLTPAGGEVRVNTDASLTQTLSIYGGGNVAMDSSGNYLVVWNDLRTNSGDVYFQRYNAAGVAQGANTLVNTTTVNGQDGANVAMDGSGNFVVVWASDGQDGSTWGVFARRFDASGAALGGEFQVNSTTSGMQNQPTVAMSSTGAFVVAWTDASGADNDIRAQRYNASGVAQGGEFVVNGTTASAQQFPSATMADSGAFIIAWEGIQTGDFNVYARRYSAAGVAQGADFQANTYTTGTQWNAATAADSSGNFVVVWESSGQDPGATTGIYGQRYNASGAAQGAEFRVNTTTADAQTIPAVAMNSSGGFVVSWSSYLQDGSGDGVYAQEFDASGNTNGGELRVAATSSGTQQHPAVAYTGNQVVVAWNGEGPGDTQGVFARRLQTSGVNQLVVDTASDVADGDTSSVTALYNDPGADGFISLREAITAANNTPNDVAGADRIEFAIAGTGVHTINVASALPVITDPVELDARTDDSFAVNGNRPAVLLDGNGGAYSGLVLGAGADASTVAGLVIRDFGNAGLWLQNGSSNNSIVGNYIGALNNSGQSAGGAEANGQAGVLIEGANNTVGGTTAAERNVLAGNAGAGISIAATASGTIVHGNYIGVDATGATALGNSNGVVVTGAVSGVQIGGATAGAGNVISGNTTDGIEAPSVLGLQLQGNIIGADASGTSALPNLQDGLSLGGSNALIGGTTAAASNLFAYNARYGLDIWLSTATGNSVLGNRFVGNGDQAIDLGNLAGFTTNDAGDGDTGANGLQNYPVLTAAVSSGGNTTVTGNFNSNAATDYRIEFFSSATGDANNHGEGQVYLGSTTVTTNGSGNASFNAVLTGVSVTVGHVVSATATVDLGGGNYGSSSEFAANVSASAVPAGISVTAISGNTTEAGGSATFSVVLDTAPLANVQVPVSSGNGLEGSVSSALLTFTPANWATPQVVTVVGQDDTLVDGNRAYSVVLGAATSGDAAYNGIDAADVAVTNTDNDTVSTITVSTTSDTADGDTSSLYALLANPGADGFISLREAITAANNTANGGGGADIVAFNIAGAGPHVITPGSALPAVTQAVVLDGSTDPDYAGNGNRPVVVLDGNNLAASGLVLAAGSGGSTVRGLVVRDFGVDGISVQAGSDGNTIAGNFIGRFNTLGADAGAGEGNAGTGIYMQSNNNVIGGLAADDRNLVSGNGGSGIGLYGASGNLLAGNIVGLAADGATVLANGGSGVRLLDGASNNTVGGATAAHRNIISGNGVDGVQIGGTGNSNANIVRGNYIGLDAGGTLDRGNTGDGIDVKNAAQNNQLLANVVAGNDANGIDLGDTGASSGTVVQGNWVGTQADGVSARANAGAGIRVGAGGTASNSVIGGATPGQGNTVAFNTGAGVWVAASNGVAVLRNSVHDNGGLGIDLGTAGVTNNDIGDADSGANGLQNFPVLGSANSTGGNTTITGSFSSNASTNYRIEFFSSPTGDASNHGEGRVYLGSTTVSTNGLGTASIGTVLSGVTLTAGHVVSATATVDLGGGTYGATSEFATNVSATASAAGISVGAISGNTSEAGASATFSVVLNTAPLADVQVPVASSNGIEGSVSTALLTFTTLNWATPQVVTVFGEDDTLADGNRAYNVVLGAASSGDGAYNGLDAADVAVTNTDNDTVNTVFVTTTADTADGDTSSLYALLGNKGADGQISLREAITAANNTSEGSGGADRIHFNISGTGVHTLNVASALPEITGAVVVDGTTDDSFAANSNRPAIVLDGNNGGFDGLVLSATADGSTLRGLVVRDFGSSGIWVKTGSDNHSIVGNYIGALDNAGQFAAGEGMGLSALYLQGSGTTVGGTSAALRNVIAGATFSGIWMDTGAGNTVVGNYIGLAADGSTVIGNGWDGIVIITGTGNRIGGTAAGEGNRIAGAGDDGIEVNTGTGNALLGNTITGSASLGIDLGVNDSTPTPNDTGDGDLGGNNLQNYPVLATARTDGSTQLVLTGSLDGPAGTDYRIEFFANAAAHASGHGEGQRYLGYANVTTNGSGTATISASLAVAVAAGETISATATRTSAGFTVFSDTSEFALNVSATLAPVVTTSGTPLATTENDPATPVDPALTVTDGDSANLSSATVTITGNYALGQDLLSFSNQLGITGSWNAGTGQLTLSGSASVASYQTALRSVTYSNSSDAPSTLARTVSFVVNDGVAPSAAATRSVTVAAVNDAPAVSTTGGTLVVAENDAATPVDAGLLVSDVDSASLSGATVSFTANYLTGEDLLLFTNQLGISGSWNAGTGVLTLSGTASVANYQAALRTVSYLNDSEAPDAAVRTIAFDVTDGALGSTAVTRDLQVTPVNDAPVLDNTAAMQLSTISRTNNTNSGNTVAQVIGSVGGDRITDVDPAPLEGVALTATTTAGIGAWQFSLDGGSTWQAVGAVNTNATLLLRDTDRIRFVPSGVANGQATITFRAWDTSTGVAGTTANASTAGGTSPFSSISETATLNVVESTGGPVAVADTAQTQVGAAVPINVLSNDLDPQGDPLTVLDVSNPANGTVSLGGGGTITYTPTGGFSGTDTFSYLIRDANDDLTHYWKLDGNANDSVGAANGTLMNGPATVAGAYGSALQFDGVNDHVALPDLSYTNEFTLSFRFRVDDNTGNQIQYFYSHGATPSTGLRNMVHVGLVEDANAVIWQRNQLITTVFDGNDFTDASGQLLVDVAALIGDGQWHQYTATVTPGIGTQVYVDGVLRGSVNRGGDAIDPVGSALLAARSDLDAARFLNGGGRMDSLALFNHALSGTEVATFYSGGLQQANVTVNVNATPVVVASGGSAGFTENGAPVVLDAGLLVSDANSAQLAGATVSISSNYVLGQDSLQFTNQLGITGSWNVGTGELVLSGNASVASYQAALRSVTYVNSSEDPDTNTRVLSFVVDDGLVSSAAATRNLVVTPVNDAPTASGLNVAEVYTEDTALNLSDIVASDVDNTTGSVTLTLSNPAAGVLGTGTSGAVSSSYNAGTGVWTASGALVDVNALLAALSFTPALNFNAAFSISTSVNDGVAAPVTGSKAFTGVPVNDAPTASGLNTAESFTEDTPLNLAAIVVGDVDNASLTVTLTLSDATAGALSTGTSGAVTSTYGTGTGVWTASGAVADVNALLAGLVFTPATNYISGFNISTSVSDGLAAPVTGNKTVGVVLVNDAPTASNLNAAESTPEDTALDLTDIVVADVDNANLSVTLALSNAGAGALSTGSAGAVTSSYNAGTGVWAASGAVADVNSLLAALVFTPAANFNGSLSIATSVSDGMAAPVTGSKTVVVGPVNDAPTAGNLNQAETYTEDTPLNLVDIVVSDIDNSSGSVTLTLSDPAVGALTTGTSGAVTSTFNASTGVWSASGAIADINTLLAALVFTPAANFNGTFSVTSSVSDGVAAAIGGSKDFTGVPVNDAPTASNLNTAQNYTEDQPLNLADIVAGDIDSANITARLTLSNTGAGTLSTGTAGAVTSLFNPATGVWQASGALADVNALLAAVAFQPAADFNAAFSIATSVSDGVAAPITGAWLMTGAPVNDAPTASNLNQAETYTEDTPLNLADIVVSDIDNSSGSVTLTLSDPAVGALATGTSGAVTSTFNASTGVWSASGAINDINTLLAALVFTPAANFNGTFSVASSVSDGVAAAIGGSKDFTGVAVNDAPTASNLNTAQNYTEDQPLNLADIVAGDIDSATITARLTLSNTAAGALSTGTAGAVTSLFNPATGVWQASGALANVNALLAAVVFQPAADFNAAFSIATSVSDGVAAPITGTWLMTGTPVNDAPTASNLSQAETYTEDTPLNLADIVVSDIDSNSGSVTLTLSNPAVGALATGTSGAVTSTFNASTGVWSASGAIADINTLLAAVQFVPALNVNSGFSVATWVSDGVAAPLMGSKVFSGVAVNDAPVLNTLGSLTVAEGSLTPLGAAQLQATDVDNTSAELSYTLQSAPVHGSLLNNGAVLAVGSSFTQADLDAGRVAYRHDASETTADAFDFSLGDGQATGASGRVAITVTPVNDEVPRITGPVLGVTVPENTTAVALVTATDADLPPQSLQFAIAGGADAAFFTVNSSTGELSFIAAPDFETPLDSDGNNVYQVDLRVSDGQLSSVSGLAVTVAPVNDNTPRLTSSGGAAQALLEVQEGQEAVVNLTATDADLPPAALVYSIVGGVDAGRFTVNAASGALRFVDAPLTIDPRDRDADNVYQVVVQASDGSRLAQQALSVKVRATVSAGGPSGPAAVPTPQAPTHYSGGPVQEDAAAPPVLVAAQPVRPIEAPVEEEALVPLQNRRTALVRLADAPASRSGATPPALVASAQALGEGSGVDPSLPVQDTGSLEAALGLPGTDATFLQVRPDGLSLAGLAAQSATRSSTAVPGPLTLSQPLGDAGEGAEDNDNFVQALAAPVVAGGMAFSASLLVWATRAGGLAAAMMASVPAWRSLDPLPILARDRSREEDDDAGSSTRADLADSVDGAKDPADSRADTVNRIGPAPGGPVDPPFDTPDDPVPGQPAPRTPPPAALRELLEPLEAMR